MRYVFLLLCLFLSGCTEPPAPAPTPSPTKTGASSWSLALQSWEEGKLVRSVTLRDAEVEIFSPDAVTTYDLPQEAVGEWERPDVAGWKAEEPQEGRYLAYQESAEEKLYTAAEGTRTLVERLEALEPKVFSHGPHYAWISGRLEYSDVEGGFWTLAYSQQPESDPHGGKMVLQGALPEGMETGQLATAYGSVAEQQMGIHMGGTYYETDMITETDPGAHPADPDPGRAEH